MRKYVCCLCMLFVVFAVSSVALGAETEPNSTSPYVTGDEFYQTQQSAEQSPLITFSKFPEDTVITDQYSDLGIIFGGDDPYIRSDGANPTSPVLGTTGFLGDIEGYFVNPNDGVSPATVSWFSLDAGYFDQTNSTRIEWFDLNYTKLGEVTNSVTGIETFVIEDWGIASWRASIATSEDAGYAIDNVDFGGLNLMDFTKTDDVSDNDCVSPDDPNGEITYTICWDNTSEIIFEDAYIIDFLPRGVSYDYLISVIPYIIDPNYSVEDHTYKWELGTIAPDDSGCVSLTVTVNELAEPGMYVHNAAELWDPNMPIARASEDTLVCCWTDPNIIYVDMTATGNNTGLSWENAYSGVEGLQNALTRAIESTCDGGPYTVYVAQGTYSPGNYSFNSFRIPEGSKVYGGFMVGGSDFSERNSDKYETVLTGHRFIDSDPNAAYHYHIYNNTIITMLDEIASDPNFPVDETTLLNGFTITDAVKNGIYGEGVDFTIINCTVTDSGLQGIYAADCDVAIKWGKINNSGWHGIEHTGQGNTISIENSQIMENNRRGISCLDSTPTIKNCVVFGNGYDGIFDGINITLPTEVPILYNNTIVYNAKAGIYCFDDENSEGDPNYPDYPDIRNSILYYNDGSDQITISLPFMPSEYERDDYASYCCIEGSIEDHNNINDEPGFVHGIEESRTGNPYQYHLAYDSVCKDRGDPSHDANDVGSYDMDGEDRIVNGRVDIGADEIYSCDDDLSEDDIYNVNGMDWDYDGIVNYQEFAEFAEFWLLRDPNDPGIITDPNFSDDPDYASPETLEMWREKWNSFYNLDDTGTSEYMIDVDDLVVIAHDWLWIACWKESQLEWLESITMEMMSMGGGM